VIVAGKLHDAVASNDVAAKIWRAREITIRISGARGRAWPRAAPAWGSR
jgi:hypothetical protein